MAAVTTSQNRRVAFVLRFPQLTLKSGQKVYKNTAAAVELSSGKVVAATSGSTGLRMIGVFTEDYDASSTGANADMNCVVDLGREYSAMTLQNDTNAPVTLLWSSCYMLDNFTVCATSSGNSVAGTVIRISATDGVTFIIENVATSVLTPSSQLDKTSVVFTANDYAPTAGSLVNGMTYVVDKTVSTIAAASTISLPTSGVAAGLTVFFAGNGTQDQTVTYRDGTTNLTTALTASKRHMVKLQNVGDATTSKWVADAYVDAN